jgi:hypothetical protein
MVSSIGWEHQPDAALPALTEILLDNELKDSMSPGAIYSPRKIDSCRELFFSPCRKFQMLVSEKVSQTQLDQKSQH